MIAFNLDNTLPVLRAASDILTFLEEISDPTPLETKGTFNGHQIAVRLSATELKLYVDGQIADAVKPSLMPRRDVALVRGSIKDGARIHVVEVYGRSSFRPKIKICVNGEKLAGDDF